MVKTIVERGFELYEKFKEDYDRSSATEERRRLLWEFADAWREFSPKEREDIVLALTLGLKGK